MRYERTILPAGAILEKIMHRPLMNCRCYECTLWWQWVVHTKHFVSKKQTNCTDKKNDNALLNIMKMRSSKHLIFLLKQGASFEARWFFQHAGRMCRFLDLIALLVSALLWRPSVELVFVLSLCESIASLRTGSNKVARQSGKGSFAEWLSWGYNSWCT